MTRRRFTRAIALIASLSLLIIIMAGIDIFVVDRASNPVAAFFKDMSVYFLLCIAPYVAFLFSVRQKFVEKIEAEWRRVVEIKTDIMIYCDYPNDTEFKDIYRKLSCAIDNMRCIYSNVGQDKYHIGYYPFETLHDFRRALEILIYQGEAPPSSETRRAAKRSVDESFKAFRDIYLIEIEPPEPNFPIISRNMKRQKKDGASKEQTRMINQKQAEMQAYFAVSGDSMKKTYQA